MSRIETDSLGEVSISENAYWGAQTERSLKNFAIGEDKFPKVFIKNYALLKKIAAQANLVAKDLSDKKAKLIMQACDEILKGEYDDQFPLSIWQTGSGTQTNMNLNEVIANLASELAGKELGSKYIHPNDDVNKGQSSNDSFPTAMQMSIVELLESDFLPAAKALILALKNKAEEFKSILKIGRTHLMDAVPMTCTQEFEAWACLLEEALININHSQKWLLELPIAGTAIGTGINCSKNFGKDFIEILNGCTGLAFTQAENKFSKISAHDNVAAISANLKIFAGSLNKVANDIRWLGSGPRCGLSELLLPENEPGSSIMPGKVNPTQCEAVSMLCGQVYGNDAAVSFGAANGQLQLNTYKPMMLYNVIHSIRLLSDGMMSFNNHCIMGLKLNKNKIDHYLERSLMVVTALVPKIGYEKASKVAQQAYKSNSTVKEEVLKQGLMSSDEFESLSNFERLV